MAERTSGAVRSRSSLQRAMEMSVPPAARHEDMPQQQAVEMGCLPAARHGDGAPAASGGDGRPPGGAPWRPAPCSTPWGRGPSGDAHGDGALQRPMVEPPLPICRRAPPRRIRRNKCLRKWERERCVWEEEWGIWPWNHRGKKSHLGVVVRISHVQTKLSSPCCGPYKSFEPSDTDRMNAEGGHPVRQQRAMAVIRKRECVSCVLRLRWLIGWFLCYDVLGRTNSMDPAWLLVGTCYIFFSSSKFGPNMLEADPIDTKTGMESITCTTLSHGTAPANLYSDHTTEWITLKNDFFSFCVGPYKILPPSHCIWLFMRV
jgi:hypothetical protein